MKTAGVTRYVRLRVRKWSSSKLLSMFRITAPEEILGYGYLPVYETLEDFKKAHPNETAHTIQIAAKTP